MKEYNPKYYRENRDKILKYRKSRREKDRENWRRWWDKKLHQKRREAMRRGSVYTKKNPYSSI